MVTKIESILSEPGQFWIVSEGRDFEPAKSMEGLLTIADDGQAELELLPERWTWDIPLDDIISGRKFTVVGRLRRIEQSVRLTDPWLKTLDPPRFQSFISLVVPCDPASLIHDFCIESLTIPLENAWPWLGPEMPEWQHDDQRHVVNYPLPYAKSFQLSIGLAEVSYSYHAALNSSERKFKLKQSAEIQIKLHRPTTLLQAQSTYLDFEDLLVLLANQECGLHWPKVDIGGVERSGVLYCARRRKIGGAISYLYCWLPYSEIEEEFGSILDEWLTKRSEYGAAFHLYLATRRGNELYAEHRFMNLMWGLEALHRKHWPQPQGNSTIEAKVKRIDETLKVIANSDDRRKIRNALRQELRLEDRLREMFSSLPIGISRDSINAFSKNCADRRNDISHHGGPRDEASYNGFPLVVHELSSALAPLYHALILGAIGISSKTTRDIFRASHKSFREKAYMKRAGLVLPDEV